MNRCRGGKSESIEALRQALLGAEDQLQRQWQRHWRCAEQLLAPIAQLVLEILCSPTLDWVTLCQGPTCTLWYLDVSKNQRRRWCTMSVCDNRAKAAAHHAR